MREHLYIDGEWVDGDGDEVLAVVNPATEQPIASVPQATTADVRRAILAARTAFDDGPWPRMSATERAVVMRRMAESFEKRRADLVELNIAEAGSVRSLAEVVQVGVPLEHFVDMVDRVIAGFAFDEPLLPHVGRRGMGQGVIRREPFGVAALISAYNFPLFLNVSKLAPALAAGCTCVLKPSPYTPLEALVIGEVCEEAGVPPGVVNIVTGDVAAGTELTTHLAVDLVSFTGSDAVGRQVYVQAAATLKKVVLVLGGKSANVVLSDADLDRVVPNVVAGFTTHAGQGCNLLTRTIVHRSLHDELVARVSAAIEGIVVGDPADPATTMGPLISAAQRAKVEALIATGVAEGAALVSGGDRTAMFPRGFFVAPALFAEVDNRSTIAQTEFFGPVGVVIPFDDEEDAIRMANDTPYGLNAGVWSADPVRAYRLAGLLRAGSVNVNGGGGGSSPYAAFGGYKQSGLGREWGSHGLSEFLETKTISWSVGR